jgi:Zn-finger protein
VIFPLDNVNRYRASGILIDTLSRGKIFIAPNIGHFKEFKDCGLFYDENNFEEILRQAFLLSNEEVKRFKRNILNEIEKINSQNLNEILFSKF